MLSATKVRSLRRSIGVEGGGLLQQTVLLGVGVARIGDEFDLAFEHLLALDELEGVFALGDPGALERHDQGVGGRHGRGLETHGPPDPVHPAPFLARQRRDELAVGVVDLDLEVAEEVAASEPVVDRGRFVGIRADKLVVGSEPRHPAREHLVRGAGGQEGDLGGHDLGGEATQRGQVVDDVDPAAVGGDDEIVLGGVDGEVVDGDLGEDR